MQQLATPKQPLDAFQSLAQSLSDILAGSPKFVLFEVFPPIGASF